MTSPYRIEVLAKHPRDGFDCGNDSLNDYLHRIAGQDQRKRFSVCYLLLDQATAQIAGYYTLSSGGVSLADLPDDLRKGLPRYPSIPIARIGRLAVSIDLRGQGLGGVLLFDAIKRASISELGVYAILVDAIDAQAVQFYKHYGFQTLESDQQVLFLPISVGLKQITSTRH